MLGPGPRAAGGSGTGCNLHVSAHVPRQVMYTVTDTVMSFPGSDHPLLSAPPAHGWTRQPQGVARLRLKARRQA